MKILKNDTVFVVRGKDRGKSGKVMEVFPRKHLVVVEGANMRKRHRKPRRTGEKGQILEIPAPLHVSNVKLLCPKCGQSTRVGYNIEAERKVRICKKCNQELV